MTGLNCAGYMPSSLNVHSSLVPARTSWCSLLHTQAPHSTFERNAQSVKGIIKPKDHAALASTIPALKPNVSLLPSSCSSLVQIFRLPHGCKKILSGSSVLLVLCCLCSPACCLCLAACAVLLVHCNCDVCVCVRARVCVCVCVCICTGCQPCTCPPIIQCRSCAPPHHCLTFMR